MSQYIKGYAYVIDVVPMIWHDAQSNVVDLSRKNLERRLEDDGLLPLADTFGYEVVHTMMNTEAGMYDLPGDHTDAEGAYQARVVFKMKGYKAILLSEFESVEK